MAEREGDDGLRLQAHHSGWTTWFHAGDPAKTREHADAGRLLYDPEKHASHRLVYGGHDPGVCAQISGSWAESLLGYPDEALASIAKGLALAERIAHPFTLGLALLLSSQVYLNRREPDGLARRGDRAAALAALREGLETADATGEHKWDAELYRRTGTVLLAENKRDEGQASLQQAIRIAQAQQAKSLQLRAATSLARLWGEQGRRPEARDLLAPVYGWFTEGFDTADLKEAKALLDQLA